MRTLRAVAGVLGVFVATAWTTQAWAWGDLGHNIICEIAVQELNATTRREVRRLIRLDPEFSRFADSRTGPITRRATAGWIHCD
jgi:hypothetical protein